MNQSQFMSGELRQALDDTRGVFLDGKLTIHDVSNDIRLLEDELNSSGAADDFAYVVGRSAYYEPGRQIEDYEFNAPTFDRHVVWRKHGARWRLFYCSVYQGWDVFGAGSLAKASAKEEEFYLSDPNQPGGGIEVFSKPLIDMSAEIRLEVHPQLPDFVKAMAADWTESKYQRHRERE